MIAIAELLDPAEPAPPWPLLKQVGIDHVVSLLEAGEQRMRFLLGVSQDETPGVIEADTAGAELCWSLPALTRLKQRFVVAPCSNGHIAQSVNLARHAGLPWDAILGAEIARAYKPDPRVYRASVAALGL